VAIKTQQAVAVGNSARVLLAGEAADVGRAGSKFTIINTGAKSVFIGDATVTAATGITIAAGGTFNDTLEAAELIYGICGGSDTSTVDVWESGY
jgi:hypothetical protein